MLAIIVHITFIARNGLPYSYKFQGKHILQIPQIQKFCDSIFEDHWILIITCEKIIVKLIYMTCPLITVKFKSLKIFMSTVL